MDVDGVLLWRGVRIVSIRRFIIHVAFSISRGGKMVSVDTINFLASGKNTL